MMKRILIAGTLLLAFTAAAIAAPEAEEKKMSKTATKLMNKALKAIQEKQPDQAIDLLLQVTAMEPENAMVRHNLGVLYFDKGMTDEAISNFEAALRLQPDYRNAQLALRQALFESGKAASSKQEFEKANGYLLKLEGQPRPEGENRGLLDSANYLLGFNFFSLKQYPRAAEFFTKCQASEGLEKENRDLFANATYFLGMLGHIQAQYEASNVNFRKYLELFAGSETKPEFYVHANFFIGANLFRLLEARLAKGEVAGLAESAAEIMPYLEQGIANKLPSEDAYVMLGNCHVYRKEYDKAIETYQRLIETFPQSQQLKSYEIFLGELKKMQQQAEKAKPKR